MKKSLLNKLKEEIRGFFTGIKHEVYIIRNPFTESGLPLVQETKYIDANTGAYRGSGYSAAKL